MTEPAAAALAWVLQALSEAAPREDWAVLTARAEELHAVAVEYDRPVEDLVNWIHAGEEPGFLVEDWQDDCLQWASRREAYSLDAAERKGKDDD